MAAKKNLLCKYFGHKYVRTVDNRLYYVNTCVRCGDTQKIYKMPQDQKPIVRGPRW